MFLNDLEQYLNQTKQVNAFAQILVWDMNININNSSNVVHDYLNLLSDHNYVSMINQMTRVHGMIGSFIDHIFLKRDRYNIYHDCLTMVFENHITDHRATILEPDNFLRNIQYLSYKGLKRDLANYDWSSYYSENNVEVLTEMFTSTLKKLSGKIPSPRRYHEIELNENSGLHLELSNRSMKKTVYTQHINQILKSKKKNLFIIITKYV
nr:unnamed protein product [Callosobruchus chinensis]